METIKYAAVDSYQKFARQTNTHRHFGFFYNISQLPSSKVRAANVSFS